MFELPVRALRSHERLASGLKCINAAVAALHEGRWDHAALEARRACEAAAGVTGAENPGPLFDALVQQVVPDVHDAPKRETLNALMKALKPLRNAGAHGDLRMAVDRRDAELAVTVVLGLFRYMGEALAEPRR